MSGEPPSVVISAGFNKTHMTTAARELVDRDQLALAITGLYPTPRLTWVLRRSGLATRWRFPRLLERDEGIPAERLRTLGLAELAFAVARAALLSHARGAAQPGARLCAGLWRLYGWWAGRQLRHLQPRPDVYHYRAGYGQSSIDRARELGIRVVCDQALAHPAVLSGIMAARGRWRASDPPPFRELASPLDRAALSDIERADAIIVNSDFVKETFLACGWPEERVHVVYLGVDENFLAGIPRRHPRGADGPLRLLFAGRFERRKGIDEIVEALARLETQPWRLVIAGPISAEVRSEKADFLADPRVTAVGSISRAGLAEQMLAAEVLLVPSYAEGSARVAFEALACGCYVITTPNSGTIVEDGVHGAVIPAGDAPALAQAIAAAGADRPRLAEIGNRNAALVLAHHRQSDYGAGLGAVYAELVGDKRTPTVVA